MMEFVGNNCSSSASVWKEDYYKVLGVPRNARLIIYYQHTCRMQQSTVISRPTETHWSSPVSGQQVSSQWMLQHPSPTAT